MLTYLHTTLDSRVRVHVNLHGFIFLRNKEKLSIDHTIKWACRSIVLFAWYTLKIIEGSSVQFLASFETKNKLGIMRKKIGEDRRDRESDRTDPKGKKTIMQFHYRPKTSFFL